MKSKTKEQILQKHFTAEFGHDGHGKFMQYILDAMEEYAQQQVKNLNIPAVIKSLPDSDEIRMKAREFDEKDFDQWWWETVYKGNVL